MCRLLLLGLLVALLVIPTSAKAQGKGQISWDEGYPKKGPIAQSVDVKGIITHPGGDWVLKGVQAEYWPDGKQVLRVDILWTKDNKWSADVDTGAWMAATLLYPAPSGTNLNIHVSAYFLDPKTKTPMTLRTSPKPAPTK